MLAILDVDAAVEGLGHASRAAGASPAEVIGPLIGLFAVILGLGMPVFIVGAVLRHRLNRQKLMNELALKLAEKGQPLPAELFTEPVRQRSDLRRGIVWAAVGLGLCSFGGVMGLTPMIGIGSIPLMMGLGFMLAAWLEGRQQG